MRKSSATPRIVSMTWFQRTNALSRIARCGSVDNPPATRNEKPVSVCPRNCRVTAVSPTSLISGYEHQSRHPVSETLNLRGRL